MDLAKRIPESEYRQRLTDECHRVYDIINKAKADFPAKFGRFVSLLHVHVSEIVII